MSGSAPTRLLVIGASGLVGGELCRVASERYEVVGAARAVLGAATIQMDLGDRVQVDGVVARFQPDVIAICSAWPNVDGCESDPARSHRENVETVGNLVAATAGSKVRLLFFSTDHVFDGRRPAYVEDDAVNPLSVYARHKREVEEMLLARGASLIARTAWVFGSELRQKNFMYRVISAARSGETLKLPERQAGCPTWSHWLAQSSLELLSKGVEGVVHLTGQEALTKAQWARLLQDQLGLPKAPVLEVGWRDAGQVAPRPERIVLHSTRHSLTQPPLASILHSGRVHFAAA